MDHGGNCGMPVLPLCCCQNSPIINFSTLFNIIINWLGYQSNTLWDIENKFPNKPNLKIYITNNWKQQASNLAKFWQFYKKNALSNYFGRRPRCFFHRFANTTAVSVATLAQIKTWITLFRCPVPWESRCQNFPGWQNSPELPYTYRISLIYMCVYLFAPSKGQPLCFSLCTKLLLYSKLDFFLTSSIYRLISFLSHVLKSLNSFLFANLKMSPIPSLFLPFSSVCRLMFLIFILIPSVKDRLTPFKAASKSFFIAS